MRQSIAIVLSVLLGPVAMAAKAVDGTASAPSVVEARPRPGESELLGCHRYPEDKRFRWGVRGEVGVGELVASLSAISCRTILVGGGATARGGKVTIEVPDLLTAQEITRLFYAALDVLGLTVEVQGKTLKVVDVVRGKEVSRPLEGAAPTPSGDTWVTRLVRLRHARPTEIAEVLGKVRSKDGEVAVYAPTQSLLITERAGNVQRIEELIALLDVPRAESSDRLFVLSAQSMTPSDLVTAIEKVVTAGRRDGGDGKAAAGSAAPLADGVVALVPVESARLVVVVGSEPGFARVQTLARRIDPVLPDDAGMARVIYLEHTNAEEMAAALQTIGLQGKTVSAAPGKPTAGGGATPPSELRIGIDKVSNSLLVYAGAVEWQMIRDLVRKLDLPRRQVYIEATILDISVDKGRNLGLSFHMGRGNGEVGGVVAGNEKGLNTLAIDAASLATAASGGGLLAGILGKSLSVAGFTLPSFGVILQALEHSKDVSVISKPHLLTMDNTKATLSVGQSIPYAAQSLGSAVGGASSLITSYQRFDVALKIDLTPHLNDSDSVRLELDAEISDVPDGQAAGQQGGPTTNKRTLKTSIVVSDGETVVLGGLQKESQSQTTDKIPVLGDIPVLGKLFQTRGKQRTKQDLLIVLTPYVIRGPSDLRRIFERKQAERREFVERFSAFADESVFDAHVDYRRKRGLLEEINRLASDAEREAQTLREAQSKIRRRAIDGPILPVAGDAAIPLSP